MPKKLISGNVLWGSRIGGTGDDTGYSIAVDSSGNVYVTGIYSSNPLTLYNKDGSAFATTLTNSGSYDVFIAKYNTNGNVLWVSRIGGTGDDFCNSIAVDSSGSVYVTGYYSSNPLTLYNKDGSAFSTTLTNSGSRNVFIAKYDTNGNVLWGSRIGGTGDDFGNSIAVDSSGSVYVTGPYSSSTLTLYNNDGSAFSTTLTNSSPSDILIAKYYS
jgi:ribonuclease HIII